MDLKRPSTRGRDITDTDELRRSSAPICQVDAAQATGLTALDARENDFDLMGVQIEALKKGAGAPKLSGKVGHR